MREHQTRLATLITLEQGKPVIESCAEIANAADFFEWFAEEGRRSYGRTIPARQPGHRMRVVHEPVGPVAAFAAWNVPAQTLARKVGASLAAGCSVIMKPSEETPATALALAALLAEAGLPGDVLSIVYGVPDEISEYLIKSDVIRKITFTGSTRIGRHLGERAAANMKLATMELGGHAPVVVFDDVDVEAVAKSAVGAKYRNAGQTCVSPTRFYVHERVYSRFVEVFARTAKDLAVGDGLDPRTQMGPCANTRRIEAMQQLVSDAVMRGGKLVVGGERIGNSGFFFQPTFIVDVVDDAAAMNVEPFGPLALARPFATQDEAFALANRLPFGLAA
jgi:succinate-semialdehyde dehydrogenase/glutarate-semialdehyde dehydrogenase